MATLAIPLLEAAGVALAEAFPALLGGAATAAILSIPGDQAEDRSWSQYERVFENRPAVGWMLYLPRGISQQQVPEARDLIPIVIDGAQAGTIIASVTGEIFSADNPEHVKIANAIEVRLVDQDLLPLYADFHNNPA